jgi:Calcineurin-like phosphoesterase
MSFRQSHSIQISSGRLGARRVSTKPGEVDIIGDVHGCAGELHALLDSLGYRRSGGIWQHPEHRLAVFTGDLINYGPNPRAVLQTVSAMMLAGNARCVMGNHEFNALLHYHTGADGLPLRAMTERQFQSHEPTLRTLVRAFPVEWSGWLKWFQSLPLWYDAGTFRVVHACWDREARTFLLQPAMTDHLLRSCAQDTVERHFVERLLKGPVIHHAQEDTVPPVRIRWWTPPSRVLRLQDIAVDELPESLANEAVPSGVRATPYDPGAPLLFVGHYSRAGEADLHLAPNVICVDSGVAHGGRLAAWRLHGHRSLPVFAA